ncbi:MAG: hypothetical protein U9O91_03290 [Candidatus Caldatribacteriota bacterium]|nr:hypothetical protein [Candidatus Caldatribacteriota bacterium]
MNKSTFWITLIVLLTIFSLSSYAKVTLDETKMYLKTTPIDYITRGEDFTYNSWINKYEIKRKNYQVENSSIKSKIIIGDKIGDYIEYDPQKDVKNISINLEKINKIRNQGDIIGMFVEKGKLYVVIEEIKLSDKEIKYIRYPEDITILIRGIFVSPDHCIWQTIDPPPNQYDWDKYGLVYYGGMVENTHVGMVMFESDRIMKCLSGGYDNRSGRPITLSTGYKSEWNYMPKISFDNQSSIEKEEWHRFWFTTKDTIVQFDPDTKAVKMVGNPLSVKTERMEMIGGKLESTFDPDYNSSSYKWTKHFENNLLSYAKYYPVLYELHELSRWTALLNALYETGFIFENIDLNNFPYIPTPVKTPVISVIKERTIEDTTETYVKTITRQISLTGGVGLEEVTLQQADLSELKKHWLSQYENGSPKITCICD